ncbi:uncharacterized protein LOC103314660 [Tribolium castaneum]|uniref:uncharacterized protein LOC103314660 n=1 Tax=Tribolium castaneum TaxID=7070 RepID=UPI0030FE6B36
MGLAFSLIRGYIAAYRNGTSVAKRDQGSGTLVESELGNILKTAAVFFCIRLLLRCIIFLGWGPLVLRNRPEGEPADRRGRRRALEEPPPTPHRERRGEGDSPSFTPRLDPIKEEDEGLASDEGDGGRRAPSSGVRRRLRKRRR